MLLLGDAVRPQDLVAPCRSRDATLEPSADLFENRLDPLAAVFDVTGRVQILDQCVCNVEADVMFMSCGLTVSRRRFVSRQGAALPRILRAAITVRSSVLASSVEPIDPVVQQRSCRIRLREQQGRHGERLDVPHHMATVVVVIGPICEPEHRGATRRRGMGGGV